MNVANAKWFRGVLLAGIYVLGVLGIVGSGGGGDSGFDLDCAIDGFLDDCVESPTPPPPPPPAGTIGFSSAVDSIALAVDGSDDVYVGGAFTIYKNLQANRIARLNNDGSLDTGFVTGSGFDARTYTVSAANDGSGDVYAGGDFTNYNGTAVGKIARLNLDGTLDTDFSTGTGFDDTVKIIALANDGSGDVYVGGVFTSYDGVNVGSGVIRLNNDGSLDTGFNTGSGWGEDSIAPAIDGSGDIYVARRSSPGIARLDDDGLIDTVFDTGLTGFDDSVRAVAVATDGSDDVYATGFFSDYNGTAVPSGLTRLDSNGALVAGFVTDPGFISSSDFITPAIDGSNDIYVTSGEIVRLNDDGSIDPGFDISFLLLNSNPDCAAMATDGSGDIYVGGRFTNILAGPPANFARFTSAGAIVK